MKKVIFYSVISAIAGLIGGVLIGTNQIKPTIQSKGFSVQMKPHIGDTSGVYEILIWQRKGNDSNVRMVNAYFDLKKRNDNAFIGTYEKNGITDTVDISIIKIVP